MKAVHRIIIKDPVKAEADPNGGWIKHKVKNCNQLGQEVPLSPAEQSKYDQTRQGFEDADFHLHKNGLVRIVFKIKDQPKGKTQWQFRDIPLTIKGIPKSASLWRSHSNPKKAVVIFKARGNQAWKPYKYTLHYEDAAGSTADFDHDPIIRNGSIRPGANFITQFIQVIQKVFNAVKRAFSSGFGFL